MIALLVRILRILVALFLLRLLVRFVAAAVQGYRRGAVPPADGVDLVRDQVCDTFLPRGRALVATVDGRERHFCSTRCRDRALGASAPPP